MEPNEKRQVRSFAAALAVVLAVIASLPMLKGKQPILWLYLVSAVSLGLGLAWTAALKPLFRIWMAFARLLGTINTYLLLTLTFVLVFVPIGLFLRLIRKDFLDRKIEPNRSSYWQPCEEAEDVEEYFRQF